MNSRRNFLKKTAAFSLGTIAASSFLNQIFAGTPAAEEHLLAGSTEPFTLPALPYAYDALEPHIDKMTMEIHHDKHHKAYVDNLNKAIVGLDSGLSAYTRKLEDIFKNITKLPDAVRNNAGGHYNHSLFWTMMMPMPKINTANAPQGKLAEAIKTTFGTFEEFQKQFTDAAMKRFGSGWAWLVLSDGKLKICSTANQDNPLMMMDSVEVKGKPVLALDVWEHAYYLKNQNRRMDYINSWWNLVNWETCEKLFTS